MTLPRYMAVMTAIYLCVFVGIFWYLGEAPAGSPLLGVATTIFGAAVMGIAGTLKMMSDPHPDQSPLLMPTIGHVFVLVVIGLCLATFE